MPRSLAALALLLSAATAAAQPLGGYRWDPPESVDGCEVSTARVPGKEYVAARAVCEVAAGLDVIGAVLEDIERFPEWMQDCAETRVLKVVDPSRDVYLFWFRQHVALFTDRDMILRSETVVREDGRRVVRAWSTSEVAHDSGKGYVRMPAFYSEWVLERLDAGRSRVSLAIDPDLAAGLPVGMANSTIRKTPLRSVLALRRMVRLERYARRARAPGPAAP